MANKEDNPSLGKEATPIVDGVATSSVTFSKAAVNNEDSSNKSAESTLSSAQETKDPDLTSLIQPPPSRPLWNTPEGRIAGYKRKIQKNYDPADHPNLEALIRYYEDGGKVPEGHEEVWAIDGQVSFGIRKYKSFDQMPEGFVSAQKHCDSSKFCQINSVPRSDEHMITDREGGVIIEDEQ